MSAVRTLIDAAGRLRLGARGPVSPEAVAVQQMTPREKAALVVVSGLPAPPGVGGVLVRRWDRAAPRPAGTLVFVDQEGGEVRAFPSLPPGKSAAGMDEAERGLRGRPCHRPRAACRRACTSTSRRCSTTRTARSGRATSTARTRRRLRARAGGRPRRRLRQALPRARARRPYPPTIGRTSARSCARASCRPSVPRSRRACRAS